MVYILVYRHDNNDTYPHGTGHYVRIPSFFVDYSAILQQIQFRILGRSHIGYISLHDESSVSSNLLN